MKEKELNLSDYYIDVPEGRFYPDKYVKEFIKIIQDECSLSIEQRRILQNRAGKDLI